MTPLERAGGVIWSSLGIVFYSILIILTVLFYLGIPIFLISVVIQIIANEVKKWNKED